MKVAFTPAEIAAIVSPVRTAGTTAEQIRDIASLKTARPGDLSFLGNPKYRSEVATTRASVVLVPEDFDGQPQTGQVFLWVANPSAALATICSRIEQQLWPKPAPGIHPAAIIAPGAQVSPQATVGPFCVVDEGARIGTGTHLEANVHIGRGAVIGDDCWLMPGVVIGSACEIGRRVRLHAGVVVGSDGFGYEFVAGRHQKVPQVGIVVVEDDVEMGANCTIDRARFSRTVIGEGSKLDNLVHVAHNVVIGKHCILCAQVGIAGSTTLGDYVVLGGQAGVAGHIHVATGTKAGGKAGLTTDTEPGVYLNGHPAMPYMAERRMVVLQHKLPELFKRVENLEEHLKKASAPTD